MDPSPPQFAEAEKLRKQMRKVEDERVLEKKKQEEERRKHEEALKKAKDEGKIRKKECDDKAKEMEREMKAVRAEAEELRKQVDVAKTKARDAKAVARAEKRNRKKREKRDLSGDNLGQVDQPEVGLGEQEDPRQPGYPQWSRPVPPGPPASHVHPPWPGIGPGGKRSLAAMMYFDQVDRERNAEYERANREREQERATRERAAEASRTRALQMMMMGNSYF